jgi:hypothetical protein
VTGDPSRVHAELVAAAKRTVADHWPNDGGRCPVCRVRGCEALRGAIRYLADFTKPPAPILRDQRMHREAN